MYDFDTTLEIAKDKKRPTAERQTACNIARVWGILGATRARDVDPVPFCPRIRNGRAQAHKLWVEELSPQAQRELARKT